MISIVILHLLVDKQSVRTYQEEDVHAMIQKALDEYGKLDILANVAGIFDGMASVVPEDIANVALFLASDDSQFVNGQIVTVDAGWTVR